MKYHTFLIQIVLITALLVLVVFLWFWLGSIKHITPSNNQTLVIAPTSSVAAVNSSSSVPSDSTSTSLWFYGVRCPKQDFGAPTKKEDVQTIIVEKRGKVAIEVGSLSVDFFAPPACEEVEGIARLLNAKIVGFYSPSNEYKFRLPTHTFEDWRVAHAKVEALKDPNIKSAGTNSFGAMEAF